MPLVPRRRLLAWLGAVVGGGISGCMGGGLDESQYSHDQDLEADDQNLTPCDLSMSTPDPVRGEADPISTSEMVEDRPGFDDGIEYSPSNGTVRFKATGEGQIGVWSFERWGRFETANVGRDLVHRAVRRALVTHDFGSSVGKPPVTDIDESPVISVYITKEYDRQGCVIDTPSVSFSELAEHTPRSVDVTVTLEGDSYSRSIPVFAKFTQTQLV